MSSWLVGRWLQPQSLTLPSVPLPDALPRVLRVHSRAPSSLLQVLGTFARLPCAAVRSPGVLLLAASVPLRNLAGRQWTPGYLSQSPGIPRLAPDTRPVPQLAARCQPVATPMCPPAWPSALSASRPLPLVAQAEPPFGPCPVLGGLPLTLPALLPPRLCHSCRCSSHVSPVCGKTATNSHADPSLVFVGLIGRRRSSARRRHSSSLLRVPTTLQLCSSFSL
jgi:hypothetical protein